MVIVEHLKDGKESGKFVGKGGALVNRDQAEVYPNEWDAKFMVRQYGGISLDMYINIIKI